MNQTEQIWNDYHTKLQGFINSRVANQTIVDDILQDVFVKIHTHIDSLKGKDKIQQWIYQITRNTIIDYYRSHKKMDELPEQLASPVPEPDDQIRQEFSNCLLPLINSLPNLYRETLIFSEIEGLTRKEIATKLNLSISGVKSRVQRGRAMIRDIIMDGCQLEFDQLGRVIDYERKPGKCDEC